MSTSTEKFLALKRQAEDGSIDLILGEFGESFSLINDLFKDLDLEISKIKMLTQTVNTFKIQAFSKDFLFSKTLFKDESVLIEAEFSLNNDQLEIFAMCKLEKTPNKLSKLPGIIGDLLKPLDFIQIDDMVYILTTKEVSLIKSTEFPRYNDQKVKLKPGINLAGFV